ncbi:hypothetical protein NHX12_013109 [Muraenolepis orangiensis]|uniref:AXH domain-containing protein n=1 Tax=Muraenolepis orangiensis TaxID=630683 RepID=A0A9Q0DGT2_9TELE|nr:hypothetical protein NHX12_013109 [Muraenolepis orangiensis]
MNPIPDRGKECLPPKKRESRHEPPSAAAEQRAPPGPSDDFKPPVPVRSRPGAPRGEGGREGREASDCGGRPPIKQNRHILTSPPPLPLHQPLPWHVPYPGPLPLFPGHVASVVASAASSFKAPYPGDSRDMWHYFNSPGQREYSPALFSPSQLFAHHPPPIYPPDAGLAEARDRYPVKRPNGLDGPGGRTAATSRPPLSVDYVTDQTGMNVGPHGPHANGGRRQQEELLGHALSGGVFFPTSQPQEGPQIHSSLQDSHLMGKTGHGLFSAGPNHLGPEPRPERGGLLDPLGVPPAEAQIYYSLGSAQQGGIQPQTQVFPFYTEPLYNPLKEPGLRAHGLSGSHLFSHRPPSNHDRSQKEPEADQGRDREQRDPLASVLRPREHKAADGERGSLIELASGRLKRVEELCTQDFLRSADTSPEFHLSTCTVLQIGPGNAHGFNHLQVHLNDRNTQELLKVLEEYPFFVRDRGWSSCCPPRTAALYGLPCRQLAEGDVCLALMPTPTRTHAHLARPGSRAHRSHRSPGAGGGESGGGLGGGSPREQMPPPPPPPPLLHHQHHHHHHHHPQPPPPPAVPGPPPLPLPPPPPHLPPPPPSPVAQVQPEPRKRRWSAPDAMTLMGREESLLLDLPQGSKLMKWQ